MSVVIDAALAQLIDSKDNIRNGRSEYDPETVRQLCNPLSSVFSIVRE